MVGGDMMTSLLKLGGMSYLARMKNEKRNNEIKIDANP